MKLNKWVSALTCLAIQLLSLQVYADAILDDDLDAWLQEKSSAYQLAHEEKEIVIFFKDEKQQKNLSGMTLTGAISAAHRDSKQMLNNLTTEMKNAYYGFEVRDQFWSSKAVLSTTTRRFLKNLKKDKRIEAIVLNKVLQLETPLRGHREVAVDESTLTYGLQMIRAQEAWNMGIRGEEVQVGIIDSGIDEHHPDLQGKVFLAKDFTKDGHTNDRNGHGTHVAGTIGGGNASGTQIGVAPNVKFIIAKVFDDRGSTDFATLLRAMEWMINPDGDESTDDAPRVVNNSWGADSQFIIGFRNIVQTWRRFQIFPNFAAGNAGDRMMSVGAPARYPFSFAVAAVNEKSAVTGFSSRGPSLWVRAWGMGEGLPWYKKWMPLLYTKPEISAPGYEVYSSLPGGTYGKYSGTSMATPHVSGVIALVLQANPNLSVSQIEDVLESTAVDLRGKGKDNASGYGLIQADAAIRVALQTEGELNHKFVDSNLAEWNWQTP